MYSKTELIGRVGNDPEVKTVSEGNQVANFSIATTKKWKDKAGQPKEATEWHKIIIWGKLCEVVQKYVKKGMLLHVTGENRTRNYDDKDGKKVYITEVFVDHLLMLSKVEPSQEQATPALETLVDQLPSDDLPF